MSARKGKNDSFQYEKWILKAASDMRSARILRSYGGDPEAIAFHCQQTIEKALKGFLLFKTGRHFDGHNLTFLCRQAAKSSPLFYEYLDESAMLNHYYIESRYPTDLPFSIDRQAVDTIYRMAETMFMAIRDELYSNADESVENHKAGA